MKTRRFLASILALAVALPLARAQAPAKPRTNSAAPAKPTTKADQRAASYQGPKVTKDTKALGQKMIQKSKPTDMLTPVPTRVK